MKRYIYISVCIFFLTQQGFCLIGEILEAGKWLAGQLNEITEEVFRKSMLAQTTQSVALLKKNYEDSMRFYKEIKQIQENPYGILDDTKQSFLNRLENPVNKFWSEVDKKQREIDMKENKKWYEKGVASYVEEKTIGAGLDYVKQNWNFGTQIANMLKDQEKNLERIANNLATNDKEKVEQAKNELLLLQIENQRQQNLLLLKLIEIQTSQIEQQLTERQLVLQRQKYFAETAKQILESKRQKMEEKIQREEKIKSYLKAISDEEMGFQRKKSK
jgi:hypothetical protein